MNRAWTTLSLGSWASRLKSGNLRLVVENSAWLTFERLFRAVVGLLVGAWVARHLGPERYGTLAYVLSYIALFVPFATLSADAIVVRNVVHSRETAGEVLGSAMALRVALGIAMWVAAAASMAVVGGSRELTVLALIVAGTLLFQAADIADLWFQSQSQSRRTVAAKLVSHVAGSAVKVMLILTDAPLEAFAAAALLETVLAAISLAVAYRRFGANERLTVSTARMMSLVREAWPFMLSGCAIMVYARVDQLMIKQLLGAHDLGLYAAAMPLSQVWQMVPLTLAVSLAPFVSRLKGVDPLRYERTMVIVFRAFFYFGVLATLVTLALSGWLVRLLFGVAYQPAARILDVHVVSSSFCFLGIAHGLWLVNERRFAVRLWGTMLAGAATIALNALLLPRIGVIGAAIAAVVAQMIAAFLINAVLDRRGFRLQVEAITFIKS